jgi:ribonuclease P protein component
MKRSFTFGKNERLSHRKDIDSLFDQGNSFTLAPFRILYRFQENPEETTAKVLITIPKRKFKHAVDRNRLRRLIREAYRLNKHLLADKAELASRSMHVGFIYTADQVIMPFAEIEKSMIRCLERLAAKVARG